jgi:methylmalonyl-CoA mutase
MNTLSENLDLKQLFPMPELSQWQALVEKELKGLSFDKLSKQTYEELLIKPLYSEADLPAELEFYPGSGLHRRGEQAAGYLGQAWQVCQEIPSWDIQSWNLAARHDLTRGLDAIWLETASQRILEQPAVLPLDSLSDLGKALMGLDTLPVYLRARGSTLPLGSFLLAHWQKNACDTTQLKGGVLCDPLADWASQGQLRGSLPQTWEQQVWLSRELASLAPDYFSLALDGRVWHRAGASASQELACLLASAVTYLREFDARGMSPENLIPRLHWTLEVGPDFLIEVAKIRALRLLWQRILQAYNLRGSLWLHASTSSTTLSQIEPYTNMLRVTSQAFAAVLGGVSSLQTACFNQPLGVPDEFARRQARNLQLLLREESNLARMIDPLGGAYSIEVLTQQLAEQAWDLFQKLEQAGGMVLALEQGLPQSWIQHTCKQRQVDFAKRKQVLVGASQYVQSAPQRDNLHVLSQPPVSNEPLKPRSPAFLPKSFEPEEPGFRKQFIDSAISGAGWRELEMVLMSPDRDKPIAKLAPFRAAEPFEKLRQRVAELSVLPKILLIPFGDLKAYKPRLDFALGFLQVAGLSVSVPDQAFSSAEEAVQAWVESKADAAVLCSSDALYPEWVPAVISACETQNIKLPLGLAGYPKDQVAHYKTLGLEHYFYLGADMIVSLEAWLTALSQKEGV